MMSLAEERAIRDKQAADTMYKQREQAAALGAAAGVHPMSGMMGQMIDAAQTPEERTISEEEWGFTTSLTDLITRARWGVESRRVAQILYEKAGDLEKEVQRAGGNG